MLLPRLGVVIPAYDAARFLERSLGSVARQTLAPARVVVVDDGSHDDTAQVARRLGAEVIRQGNAGASRARNAGVAALDTPWVAFLDADDEWAPGALERYAQAIGCCPDVHVVFGDYALAEGDTFTPSWFARDRHFAAVERRRVAPAVARCARPALVAALIRSFAFVSTSSLAVRRDAFLSAGGFDDELLVAEDLDLLLRLFAGSTAAVVEEVLSTYHVHGANLSVDPIVNVAWERRVLERAQADPERYPASAAALLRAQIPHRLARAAFYALRAGRFADARGRFGQSWSARPSPAAAGGAALALALDNPVGRLVHAALRAAWRARGVAA